MRPRPAKSAYPGDGFGGERRKGKFTSIKEMPPGAPRTCVAMHCIGSGRGSLVRTSPAQSSTPVARDPRHGKLVTSGPREPWRHATSHDRWVEEHVPAPASKDRAQPQLRRPCRLEMNDSRSGSGFLYIRGAEPERPDFETEVRDYWARIGHGADVINFDSTRFAAEIQPDKVRR